MYNKLWNLEKGKFTRKKKRKRILTFLYYVDIREAKQTKSRT